MIGTCIVLCVFTILSLNFEYFSSLSVPTVDSVRNSFVVDALLKIKRNVLLVGATGTGKTVLAQSLLRDLPETHSQLVLNFSAATTSSAVQDIGTLACLLIRNFLDKVIVD
jgi:Cdc6-like AAA superfamily ATPase